MLRQEEYRKHPLFSMLQMHTNELQEYIRLKKEHQALQKQKEFQQNHSMQQVFGTTIQAQGAPAGGMPGGLPGPRDLFRVTKDWDNAPDGFKESDAPRALEIRRLIRLETMPKIIPAPQPIPEPSDAVKDEKEEQVFPEEEKKEEQKEEKSKEALNEEDK